MRVPILCYHRIEPPPASSPRDSNFVDPVLFGEHLDALRSFGCTGVTIADLLRWQRGEHRLPARPVAITFDDGYRSVEDGALPALAGLGWPCTIYAVSAYLGGTNVWDPDAPPSRLLDARALRDALDAGHHVGSHTRHHRRLRGLAPADALEELAGAKQDLEQALGAPCTSVAFPYGTHDRETLRRVRIAGYEGGCSLKRWGNGRGTNPLRLGRMSVGGPLPAWQLLAKLAKLLLTPSLT